jgi:hypothetical protein
MATSISIRSNVMWAITHQKFSCFQRDHTALAACLDAIATQCDEIDPTDPNAEALRLKIKAECLHELRLANQSAILRPAAGAIAFLKLGEAEGLVKEDVQAWDAHLEEILVCLRRRVEHGMVFAAVLQEWLREKHTAASLKEVLEPSVQSPAPSSSFSTSSLPPIPGSTPPSMPFSAIAFLKSHNVSDGLLNEFETFALASRRYGLELLRPDFVVRSSEVKVAIEAIASDARLHSPEVRSQLRQLGSLPDLIDEMAGAFTITRRHLAEWVWSPTGIRSDLQKHLSGKKRAFLSVEVHEAIFLETIGQQWSAHFRDGLMRIRTGDAWPVQQPLLDLQMGEARHLESMLDMLEASQDGEPDLKIAKGGGVTKARVDRSRRGFIAALQSGSYVQYSGTDQDQKADSKVGSGWGEVIDASRTAAFYSDVFRHLRTDIALVQTIAPEDDLIVLHSDLEDFGPSVPHHITLEVLKFFGLPQGWLSWFERYLKLPQLDSSSKLTTATCGSPFGLSISMLLNELLLVLLDCAIAAGSGVTMNRQHDDFWVWSTDALRMERAWTIMNDFTKQTELSWNASKTGCATVVGNARPANLAPSNSLNLPRTPVIWGLLQLQEDGQWSVYEEGLRSLATSMLGEIKSDPSRSFLSHVTLWNKYQGYIARNVGPFTRENWSSQIPTLLSVLRRFQELVIGPSTLHDTLVGYFRARFPMHSDYALTKAILAWPIQLGGFQLHPHVIRTMVCSKQIESEHTASVSSAFAGELAKARHAYERYRQAWTSAWGQRAWHGHDGHVLRATWSNAVNQPDPVTEADFVRWHALQTSDWQVAYDRMTSPITVSPEDIAEMVDSVYGLLARGTIGEKGEGLIDGKLVPAHVAADIDAAAREMFASMTM